MSAPVDAVPRDYNFAADILKRNLDAGRGDKVAYIDHRGSYSYAASWRPASSASATCCARSTSAAKSAC